MIPDKKVLSEVTCYKVLLYHVFSTYSFSAEKKATMLIVAIKEFLLSYQILLILLKNNENGMKKKEDGLILVSKYLLYLFLYDLFKLLLYDVD